MSLGRAGRRTHDRAAGDDRAAAFHDVVKLGPDRVGDRPRRIAAPHDVDPVLIVAVDPRVDMAGFAAVAFFSAASRSAALTNVAAVPRGAGVEGAPVACCCPLTTMPVNAAASPTAATVAFIMRGL